MCPWNQRLDVFSPHSSWCVVKTLKGGLNPPVLVPEAPCSVLV